MKSVILTLMLAMQLLAISQQTQLDIKQKGKNTYQVSIFLCDNKGNPGIAADTFIASDKVYFIIIPNEKSERPYFKESDVEEVLNGIQLWQEQVISQSQPMLPIIVEKKITRVVLTFAKKDLKLWQDFVFKSDLGTAAPIKLSETYFNDFAWFNDKAKQLERLKSEEQYTEMLLLTDEVLDSAANSQFVSHMHFYNDLTASFPTCAITEQASNFKKEFADAESRLLKDNNYNDLLKLSEILNASESYFKHASKYVSSGLPQSKPGGQLISNTLNSFRESIDIDTEKFKQKNLKLLETGKYEQYQFRLFVDLIYNKILGNGTFTPVKTHFTIDSGLNEDDENKLETTGWEQEFSDLLFSLTSGEKDKKQIFNNLIINNLEEQIAAQPKPYFELFKAANSAAAGNDDFEELITQAIGKSSIADEVALMEIMQICYQKTEEELSETVIKNLNAGLKKLKDGKWKEADFSFELAIRHQSQFAPAWYYLGYSEYKLGEVFSAQSRIDQSLALAPNYVSPRIFTLSLLKDQGDFTKILTLAKEGLQNGNVYLLHFWKADAHLMLKQFPEAIDEIKNGCISLNPNQEDAYFLLGDVYVAFKKYDLAKEAYQKTQQINPFESARFNEKMSQLPATKP